MPKVIPEEIRLKAMELFMEGQTVPSISSALATEFDVEVKVPPITHGQNSIDGKRIKLKQGLLR